MPRITPGITSGVSISSDSAALPGNRARSIRKALAVPTTTDSAVTTSATITLVQMLSEQLRIVEQSRRGRWRRAEEPVEREAAPRRGRVGCVVEREHRHHRERHEQEDEERADVQAWSRRAARRPRQRRDHARLMTSPKRWPLSFSPSPDDRGGQREQQEAERRALLPVEARDELRVDLLGEPQRVLAAEQRRRQVVADGEHEHDDPAGDDAGRGVRNDDLRAGSTSRCRRGRRRPRSASRRGSRERSPAAPP